MTNEIMQDVWPFIIVALAFFVGYLWPFSRKVKNGRPTPSSDGYYWSVYVDGIEHLFTDEALAVARTRAEKHARK